MNGSGGVANCGLKHAAWSFLLDRQLAGCLESEAKMKRRCYSCGGINLVRRILDELVFDGDELLGIVKVAAYVCSQCGDSYLPHSSMKRVWKERERLKAAKIVSSGSVKRNGS